ncbi:hypothetical protein [Paenibacillus spongiae]|uniref:Outer membrane protein assembly factor BamE n=1 Tax=Paenibacillus spongiae TaxID=2909671 RepID=A0ABY5S3K5_9BACL|nr:hypothetical protein [Paenibacillus spongiae]UVI28479.1 hypothetical protein L1F29_23930 [Paenibacillus spongiae]
MKRIFISFMLVLFLTACQSKFNEGDWQNEPDMRYGMVNDFINKHEPIGLTEQEVVDLLGEPEQRLEDPVVQYVYYLGRAGMGVDDSLFVLKFDEDEKLESHQVTHD